MRDVAKPLTRKPGGLVESPGLVMPRPTNPVTKALLKGPLLLWRLGLGPLVGRVFLILTTTGRRSGQPRRTVVEFHEHAGRKYVLSFRGPGTDWYRNLLANPHTTIQTAGGSEHAVARRVTDRAEIAAAYDFLARLPVMKQWAKALGVPLNQQEVVAHKDDFILLTFEPTDEPTPPPVQPDLWWVWPLAEGAALIAWVVARDARKQVLTPA